jgi:hypothetical protein
MANSCTCKNNRIIWSAKAHLTNKNENEQSETSFGNPKVSRREIRSQLPGRDKG